MKFVLGRLLSIAAALGLCFAIDVFAHSQNDYTQRLVALAGLYVTLSVSLNLINGITGQFSIGHAAFYQVGAYCGGFLSVRFYDGSPVHGLLWLLVMMAAGAAAAAGAGLVVGLPSLRLRGDYLAIVTMGFGEIIRIIVQNVDAFGGPYGMNVQPKFLHIWLIWLLAVSCIAVCRNLVSSAHGLQFLAVREDEIAAGAMGVNVTRVKVTAFMLGSAFAGAAGALLAHFEGFITPATFAMDVSFIILTMVVLGGSGSITGSVISAAFLSYLPEYLRGLKGPEGGTLAVTGASVAAALFATIIAAGIIRRLLDQARGTPRSRALGVAGIVGATLIGKIVIQWGLLFIPYLRELKIEAGQLRMVIFAVTLIIVMLLRPQGMLAHHELSWAFIGKILGIKAPAKAVTPA